MMTPNPTEKGYVTGGGSYFYPGAGDPLPPGGSKVHLLTRGGVAVTGTWGDPFFIGWAPLHERDREKEARL